MKLMRVVFVWTVLLSALAGAAGAQTPAPPRQTLPLEMRIDRRDQWDDRYYRPVVRIGQDYTVRAEDTVRHVVAFLGTVTVDGRVRDDVVVTAGDVRLSSTAVIEGSVVAIAGNVTIAQGAQIRRDLVVVAGAVDAPPGFAPQHEHLVIGSLPLGEHVRAVVPWFTRGLLWGRPIVQDLGWVWGIVGLFFLVSLALNYIFDRPVRACADVMTERPLSALLVGFIVLLLLAPALVLLAATVIGIAIIPFLVCAVAVGWMLGKVGVVRAIGSGIIRQSDADSRAQGARSFVIGFAAICLAYMVPVLGLIAWTMIGVFGLGAGTMTFLAAIRRESPKRAPGRGPETPGTPPGIPTPPAGPGSAPPDRDAFGNEMPGMAFSETPLHRARDTAPAAASAPPIAGALTMPRATFLDRVAAFAIDVVFVAIAHKFLNLHLGDGPYFLLLLGYHIVFWTWMGTTLGGIICSLRVVRTDGSDLRVADATVRGLSSLFSIGALGLGCVWMLQDPERQMWHDKIAGTYIVKVPKNLLATS